MSEKKAVIWLIFFTAIAISGGVLCDLYNRSLIAFNPDKFYFVSYSVFQLGTSITLLYYFRLNSKAFLAAFFSFFAWAIALPNLWDEFFAFDPSVSSPYEYWWLAVGVVISILEYHEIFILKNLYEYYGQHNNGNR